MLSLGEMAKNSIVENQFGKMCDHGLCSDLSERQDVGSKLTPSGAQLSPRWTPVSPICPIGHTLVDMNAHILQIRVVHFLTQADHCMERSMVFGNEECLLHDDKLNQLISNLNQLWLAAHAAVQVPARQILCNRMTFLLGQCDFLSPLDITLTIIVTMLSVLSWTSHPSCHIIVGHCCMSKLIAECDVSIKRPFGNHCFLLWLTACCELFGAAIVRTTVLHFVLS